MTKQELIDELFDIYRIQSFCYDNDLEDICEDYMDVDQAYEFLFSRLDSMVSNRTDIDYIIDIVQSYRDIDDFCYYDSYSDEFKACDESDLDNLVEQIIDRLGDSWFEQEYDDDEEDNEDEDYISCIEEPISLQDLVLVDRKIS